MPSIQGRATGTVMIIDFDKKISEFKDKIKRAETIALFCHLSPDGDTICSALSLYSALNAMGKKCFLICEDEIPQRFSFLMNGAVFLKEIAEKIDLAISVDTSNLSRLGANASKTYLKAYDTIAIDHHFSHENFGSLTILDETSSSCSEIVFDIIKEIAALNSEIAKLIFAGMISDNGCFLFSSVSSKTHAVASELYKYDFDKENIIYNIIRKQTLPAFNLTNRVLSKCRFYEDDKIAIIIFRAEDFLSTQTTSADTEGIISRLIDIEPVLIAFAISEVNEFCYKVRVRTKSDKINAAECAAVFGGGGHVRAAGCRVHGRLEDVVDRLIKAGKDIL